MDTRQLAIDEADLAQFAEAAKNAGQERPACHRRDQVLREAPAKLLGDLERHGLRAFGVVAAQVDVGESPPELVRDLRAQTIDVVVIAAHADDVRTEYCGAEYLSELEIIRNEDVAFKAQARRVRRHAVGQVSSRGATKY